jgi:hypothetical protein
MNGPLHEPGITWRDYFERLRAESDSIDVPDTVTTLIAVDDNPVRTGLGSGVKKVLAAVEGWPDVRLRRSRVHVSDEYLKADSTKKVEGQPVKRRGDLVKPAHDVDYWWLLAAAPAARTALRAGWKEGVTPKGGRSFTFVSARCADPLGMPFELFVDYSPSANDLKQAKDEPEWAHAERVARVRFEAERMDREYNTGESWLNRDVVFKAFGEFEAWLREATEIVGRVYGQAVRG